MDEERQILKRFLDLSKQAQRKGIVMFSDFLTLNELDILYRHRQELESGFSVSGGYHLAERQIVAFLPDALYYEWTYPYVCIQIRSLHPKFAEELSHRDVLGAVMNLGIQRSKTGDILVSKQDSCIYLFVCEGIASYVQEQLFRIRNTEVQTTICDLNEIDFTPSFLEMTGIVASTRLDSMVACMAGISRSQAVALIQAGKVFLNGRMQQNNSYFCKEGEILSIRSVGKFIYEQEIRETKKGKLRIRYKKYD